MLSSTRCTRAGPSCSPTASTGRFCGSIASGRRQRKVQPCRDDPARRSSSTGLVAYELSGLAVRKLILLAPVAYPPPARPLGQDPLTLAALQAAPEFQPAAQGRFLAKAILTAAYADRTKIT